MLLERPLAVVGSKKTLLCVGDAASGTREVAAAERRIGVKDGESIFDGGR